MKNIRIAITAIFTMIGLFMPSITVSAVSLGETVSQNTVEELQAVEYENNETIGELLAPSRYSMSEKLMQKVKGKPFLLIRYYRIKKNCCWGLPTLNGYMTLTWEGIISRTFFSMNQVHTEFQ